MGDRDATDDLEQRLIAAALTCVARWGLTKTTLDDVAREAGCSRATVYRLFPGGKDTLVATVLESELRRMLDELGHRLDRATTVEDKLVHGVVFASTVLTRHPALRFVLDNEPDQLLPHVAFDRFDDLLADVSAFATPHLAPELGGAAAARTGEWVARLVLSYALHPSEAFDVTVEADARRFVRTFLLPALAPAARPT